MNRIQINIKNQNQLFGRKIINTSNIVKKAIMIIFGFLLSFAPDLQAGSCIEQGPFVSPNDRYRIEVVCRTGAFSAESYRVFVTDLETNKSLGDLSQHANHLPGLMVGKVANDHVPLTYIAQVQNQPSTERTENFYFIPTTGRELSLSPSGQKRVLIGRREFLDQDERLKQEYVSVIDNVSGKFTETPILRYQLRHADWPDADRIKSIKFAGDNENTLGVLISRQGVGISGPYPFQAHQIKVVDNNGDVIFDSSEAIYLPISLTDENYALTQNAITLTYRNILSDSSSFSSYLGDEEITRKFALGADAGLIQVDAGDPQTIVDQYGLNEFIDEQDYEEVRKIMFTRSNHIDYVTEVDFNFDTVIDVSDLNYWNQVRDSRAFSTDGALLNVDGINSERVALVANLVTNQMITNPTYVWTLYGETIGQGQTLETDFTIGEHDVVLTFNSDQGSAPDVVHKVTILPRVDEVASAPFLDDEKAELQYGRYIRRERGEFLLVTEIETENGIPLEDEGIRYKLDKDRQDIMITFMKGTNSKFIRAYNEVNKYLLTLRQMHKEVQSMLDRSEEIGAADEDILKIMEFRNAIRNSINAHQPINNTFVRETNQYNIATGNPNLDQSAIGTHQVRDNHLRATWSIYEDGNTQLVPDDRTIYSYSMETQRIEVSVNGRSNSYFKEGRYPGSWLSSVKSAEQISGLVRIGGQAGVIDGTRLEQVRSQIDQAVQFIDRFRDIFQYQDLITFNLFRTDRFYTIQLNTNIIEVLNQETEEVVSYRASEPAEQENYSSSLEILITYVEDQLASRPSAGLQSVLDLLVSERIDQQANAAPVPTENLSDVRDGRPSVVPREFLVRFKNNVPLKEKEELLRSVFDKFHCYSESASQNRKEQAKKGKESVFDRLAWGRLKTEPDARGQLDALKENENVRYITENTVGYPQARIPNDPEFSNQWGLRNLGQQGGVSDVDIDAPEAWDIEQGSDDIVVAVIDSGIDTTHEDLRGNIWVNVDEIANNGIDDDQNGRIDDVYGFDIETNQSDISDPTGHGTMVAGIIGARTNNGLGGSGVSWNVQLMGIKIMGTEPGAFLSDAIQGFQYARDNGANVVNMSVNFFRGSPMFEDIINEMVREDGILIVGSAGNFNSDEPEFPSGYDNVMAVGSLDRDNTRMNIVYNDGRINISNFGLHLDVAAPGMEILSTFPNNEYTTGNGTSFAAPFVSGIAALVWSKNPNFTNDEVRRIIESSVDPINSDEYIGKGRVNAYKALQMEAAPPRADLTLTRTDYDDNFRLVNAHGIADGENFLDYWIEYGVGQVPTEWVELENSRTHTPADGLLFGFDAGLLPNGEYTLRLIVADEFGQRSEARQWMRVDIDNRTNVFPVADAGENQVVVDTYGDNRINQLDRDAIELSWGVRRSDPVWTNVLDLNNDGIINDSDLEYFDENQEGIPADPEFRSDADINQDNQVDSIDFGILESAMGSSMGSPGFDLRVNFDLTPNSDGVQVIDEADKIVFLSIWEPARFSRGRRINPRLDVNGAGFERVALSGINSFDEDGFVDRYLWEIGEVRVPGRDIQVDLTIGEFVASLLVQDNLEGFGVDTVDIHVKPNVPWAPIAYAGSDRKVADQYGLNHYLDQEDANVVRKALFTQAGDPGYIPQADFNLDGFVDGSDFNLFLEAYNNRGNLSDEEFDVFNIDGAGEEKTFISGTDSFDNNSRIVSYSWMIDGVEVSRDPILQFSFPFGLTTVKLVVTNEEGHTDSDVTTLEVLWNPLAESAPVPSDPLVVNAGEDQFISLEELVGDRYVGLTTLEAVVKQGDQLVDELDSVKWTLNKCDQKDCSFISIPRNDELKTGVNLGRPGRYNFAIEVQKGNQRAKDSVNITVDSRGIIINPDPNNDSNKLLPIKRTRNLKTMFNPTKGEKGQIEILGGGSVKLTVSTHGRMVEQIHLDYADNGPHVYEWPGAGLASGAYYVECVVEKPVKKVYSQTLVIYK